ncbi:MAG: SurA N-terminal domain-containing protein [Gammaproteobacteria bacterium]
MNDRLRRWLLAALASLPIALAHGEYREVDRILAIVDDDVVLASEVVSRVNAIRAQILDSGRRPPSNELLMSQVLQRLILESIQLQMAERGGLRITDQNLTDAISNIARRNGMNMDQFRQALGADGISYEEFRPRTSIGWLTF